MSHVIHAEIRVEIEDLAGYEPEEFIAGLNRNMFHAVGNGMLTGATPEVEIDGYSMSLTHNPDSRAEQLEAYYADAIDSGKIRLEDIPKLLAANRLKPVSDCFEGLPIKACS